MAVFQQVAKCENALRPSFLAWLVSAARVPPQSVGHSPRVLEALYLCGFPELPPRTRCVTPLLLIEDSLNILRSNETMYTMPEPKEWPHFRVSPIT